MRNGRPPSAESSPGKRPLSTAGQMLTSTPTSPLNSKYPTLIQRQGSEEDSAAVPGKASERPQPGKLGEDRPSSLVLSPNTLPKDAKDAKLLSSVPPASASLQGPSPSSSAKPSSQEPKEPREPKESKEPKEPQESKEPKESKKPKEKSGSSGPGALSSPELSSTPLEKPSGKKPASSPRPQKCPEAPKVVNRNAFQACREADIRSVYDWDRRKPLGGGAYGQVFAVKHRFNAKKKVAIKQVDKDSCGDLPQLRMEISVLSTLDHPRVLHFFEAYEDFKDIYIVTELCTGGDLHECLAEVEGDAAFAHHTANQILRALVYCHSRGVCHRDLKPENVLLVRKLGQLRDPPLRLADFGLSRQLKAYQQSICDQLGHVKSAKSKTSDVSFHDAPKMDSFVGTAEYMAPEVMAVLNAEISLQQSRKFYDFRCDLWSLGVIIHTIITGELPWSLEELVAYVEESEALPDLVQTGHFSREAFDFVKQCLNPVYKRRPSARQLAKHCFLEGKDPSQTAFAHVDRDGSGTLDLEELQEYLLQQGHEPSTVKELFERLDADKDGVISKTEFEEGFKAFTAKEAHNISHDVLSGISQNVELFTSSSNMKKAVLTAAARHLGGYELQQLHKIFESVDSDGDGAISLEEWKLGFSLLVADGEERTSEWLEEAFAALDTDGSGEVDYSEFLAAVMDSHLLERRDLLWATFQDFDHSNTGSITKEDLRQILQSEAVQGIWQTEARKDHASMLAAVDADEAGELSFDAFIKLLNLS